jgi:ADP-dependent NAD(P)H-hydrate dehydratase / NAD(P)H-hydrate epimerase
VKIVSAEEMRAIDRATSERLGVPSLTLMENAGSAVATFVLSRYPKAERIAVVCGKGNNGGDGFVAARKLADAGRAVRIVLLCAPTELRGDAAVMFATMNSHVSASGEKLAAVIVREAAELDSPAVSEVFASDLIVDAVLGTGFRPPVSPLYAAAITRMNASAARLVAVDIPSGADADQMQPEAIADKNVRATGSAVSLATRSIARADAIVTFTAPRPAHVFAALTHGPTFIAPIGSPAEAVTSGMKLNLSAPADFSSLLAPRAREANKGSYGYVLVIGGSLGKAGAPAMAGFAALRAGVGLSTIATPKSVLSTAAGFHPEVMTEPLAETEDGTISRRAIDSVARSLAKPKMVVAIGPGISRNSETEEFVRALIKPGALPEKCPIVLDADGLNAFEGAAKELQGHGRSLVITPHPGEMSRLTGLPIDDIQANRLEIAQRFAREHDVIVVLKGHRTLTAAPDGTVWVNPTGNPGMATGGTGDILTGMVAGLIAQHPDHALEATALAVYLHGLSGDLAACRLGEHSLVATDLLRFLPRAFRHARSTDTSGFEMHS